MTTLTSLPPGGHLDSLAKIVLNNLENQHDWTGVKVHAQENLSRPIIYGLPPTRLYVHPDEQIAIIKAEKDRPERVPQPPELEWVLPVHLAEKLSPAQFVEIFDALETIPPGGTIEDGAEDADDEDAQWKQWRGAKRGKRLLLATVQDDSTVTYYFIHDGLVKPRQN